MFAWRKTLLKGLPQRHIRFLAAWVGRIDFMMRRRRLRPPLPVNVVIDPATICNLRCPLCPTGTGKSALARVLMSFETFNTVLGRMPWLKYISLFNWGEPFLNPDIFRMVRLASEQDITVAIHSNFSLEKDDAFFRSLADSGLDKLIVSLCGMSQAAYSAYRAGGDAALVRSNLERLLAVRTDKPKIIWRMLANKYNESEIDECRRAARQLGVEFEVAGLSLADYFPDFEIADNGIEDRKQEWLGQKAQYILPRYKKEFGYPLFDSLCTQLFDTAIINPDGTVVPCCHIIDAESSFGDLTKESFADIWHNEKYRSSRSLFLKRQAGMECGTVCRKCNLFRKCGSRQSVLP